MTEVWQWVVGGLAYILLCGLLAYQMFRHCEKD